MLTSKDILARLIGDPDAVVSGTYEFSLDVLRTCAEAIAQAVEEEIASYKATIEELQADDAIQGLVQREEMHQARLAALQAQMAVMAEVAGTVRSRYVDALDALDADGKVFVNAFRRELQDLDAKLSAAPKVVAHIDGR